MNDLSELKRFIEHLHAKYRNDTSGEVATYIPELGKADPNRFGICVMSAQSPTFFEMAMSLMNTSITPCTSISIHPKHTGSHVCLRNE